MRKKLIVKVQVPLLSDNAAGCLVYDKERTIMTELPFRSKKERDEFLKGILKENQCFRHVTDKNIVAIGDRVEVIVFLCVEHAKRAL